MPQNLENAHKSNISGISETKSAKITIEKMNFQVKGCLNFGFMNNSG
jgi:hypothetical protein